MPKKNNENDILALNRKAYTQRIGQLIEYTLDGFGITTRVAEVNHRPTDIEFALETCLGTRVADIVALDKDLAMALAVPPDQLVIEAPIPGRSLVGIRIPHPDYEKYRIPSEPLYPNQAKKMADKGRGEFENVVGRLRFIIGFILYGLSRVLAKLSDMVYPRLP